MFKSVDLGSGELQLAILFIVVFCAAFLLIVPLKKPIFSIYTFLLVWIFVPNAMFGISEYVKFWHIAVCLSSLTICLSLLSTLKRKALNIKFYEDFSIKSETKKVRKFFILFVFISVFSSGVFNLIGRFSDVSFMLYLTNSLEIVSSVMFFVGCCYFLGKKEEIVIIFKIFFWVGIYLLFEYVFCFKLGLIPLIQNYVVGEVGYAKVQFSLLFNSHIRVAMMLIVAMASGLYLWREHKRFYYLLFSILFFLPILETTSRAALLGASACFFFYLTNEGILKGRNLLLVGICLFVLVALPLFNAFTKSGSTIFEDTTSWKLQRGYSSGISRFGGYYRAIDLFLYNFPVGVGEGLSVENVRNNKISYLFGQFIENPYVMFVYKYKKTNPHNIVFKFTSEHGLFGLIILVVYFICMFKNFFKYREYKKKAPFKALLFSKNVISASYACLIGLFVFHMFDSVHMFYPIYAAFFAFSYCSVVMGESVISR